MILDFLETEAVYPFEKRTIVRTTEEEIKP